MGSDATSDNLIGTHQVMMRYMAPEQLSATKAVDHRADIYSLGLVFYELLNGELPMGWFAPPSKKVAVDVRLDEVVLRTLELETERRYQHASELITAVTSLSEIAGSPPKPLANPSNDQPRHSSTTVHKLLDVTQNKKPAAVFCSDADQRPPHGKSRVDWADVKSQTVSGSQARLVGTCSCARYCKLGGRGLLTACEATAPWTVH